MLNDAFTSTGAKFFYHQEAMANLANGKGQPIVSHLMLTDVCNHTCAFCSVQHRAGDSLPFDDIMGYLDILQPIGLKAVILSGGGNPILYKCKQTRKTFGAVVDAIHARGLEIGLITNGAPLREFTGANDCTFRKSWSMVNPATLDKITWIRISMAGLDHEERAVWVPEVDRTRTTLGFSYVAHDIYNEPGDKAHGKVSRPLDLISGNLARLPDKPFGERISELTDKITRYCLDHNPRYVRLLPNCLEPSRIEMRCSQLQWMAHEINEVCGQEVAFVQYKPPAPPKACYLGYIHPVLTPSGYVMPCDSHCLNESADHKLGGEPWRMCHWSEIGKLYEQPVRSLIDNPAVTCPGCVFHQSNAILGAVVDGTANMTPPSAIPEHANFV